MKRIAMWSGPRNLSTAMMYSFAQRADSAVWDEPFYAAYLSETGLDHPMRAAVLAAGESRAETVIERCLGPVPGNAAVFYQKQMTHHMLADWPLDWLGRVTNVFLIRHPARVIASYLRKREAPLVDDLGFAQQHRIFAHVRHLGQDPVVIDSADILADPARMMAALCDALGLAFDPAMLSWPPGPRPFDGAWAPHWYGAVHRSTGFGAAEGALPSVPTPYAEMAEDALASYHALRDARLRGS
ncbi:MAG: sulfotransferase [Pseudomonadota bacterium]